MGRQLVIFICSQNTDAISEIKCEMRRGKWPSVARARGEVRWVFIIHPNHTVTTRLRRGVYVYDLLAIGKDVSAQRRATLQYLPVETFVKMIERLIEPALLRASSTEPLQPGLSPWGPIAAGWLRELDCIAELDC